MKVLYVLLMRAQWGVEGCKYVSEFGGPFRVKCYDPNVSMVGLLSVYHGELILEAGQGELTGDRNVCKLLSILKQGVSIGVGGGERC